MNQKANMQRNTNDLWSGLLTGLGFNGQSAPITLEDKVQIEFRSFVNQLLEDLALEKKYRQSTVADNEFLESSFINPEDFAGRIVRYMDQNNLLDMVLSRDFLQLLLHILLPEPGQHEGLTAADYRFLFLKTMSRVSSQTGISRAKLDRMYEKIIADQIPNFNSINQEKILAEYKGSIGTTA